MDNLGEDFRNKFLQLPEHANTFRSASMWKRGLALLADLLVINFLIIGSFRNILADYFATISITEITYIPDNVYLSIIMISFVTLLYFALMQHYAQQTIGMMLLGIYVIPQAGFWKSIARNLYILPFFPFSLLWVIEPIYLAFKGRRVLEQLTNTSTVEVANG